jgi:hypothetical protein
MENFPELDLLERLREDMDPFFQIHCEETVDIGKHSFPIYSFQNKSAVEDIEKPVLLIVGGVHGLERIGMQVVLAFMENSRELLAWDQTFKQNLSKFKLVFYPCVNPGGVFLNTRSNPQGVDLMRNAPIDGEVKSWSLAAGHRLGSFLPLYRGKKGEAMQPEAEALCQFVKKLTAKSPFTLAVDVHSGFGMRDRLWFPYATKKAPFPHIAEMMAFKKLLDRTIPQHVYLLEPQSNSYRTHGDLWDYLFLEQERLGAGKLFIPLCLEMGSWLWIKKNPSQVFKPLGIFNPLQEHRQKRILRRHMLLFDFLMKAILNYKKWTEFSSNEKRKIEEEAISYWFSPQA